jgi:hypothetical protein
MSVDELRDIIWACLYQAGEARTLDEIATFTGRDRDAIRNALDHEWFSTNHDEVSISDRTSAQRNMT